MLTKKIAQKIVDHWGQCFNPNDLDQIMSQFQEDVVLISTGASKVLDKSTEENFEKDALRTSFNKSFEDYS